MDCNHNREKSHINRPEMPEEKIQSVASEIANHLQDFSIQESSQILSDVKDIIIERLEINLKKAQEGVNIADNELNYFKQNS